MKRKLTTTKMDYENILLNESYSDSSFETFDKNSRAQFIKIVAFAKSRQIEGLMDYIIHKWLDINKGYWIYFEEIIMSNPEERASSWKEYCEAFVDLYPIAFTLEKRYNNDNNLTMKKLLERFYTYYCVCPGPRINDDLYSDGVLQISGMIL